MLVKGRRFSITGGGKNMFQRRLLMRLTAAALGAMPALFIAHAASATTYTWSAGIFAPGVTAPNPMTSPNVLEINNGTTKSFNATSWINLSTVHWNANLLSFQNGATIDNGGRWEALSDNPFVSGGGATSTFNNTGQFVKTSGAGTTTISGIAFVNSGTIEAQTGK